MIYITERKTEQTDLRNGAVLHMVSLFVVAYPHEVAEFEKDDFKSFVEQAKKDGRLLLDNVDPSVEGAIEVSRTSKGFLIKRSVQDFPKHGIVGVIADEDGIVGVVAVVEVPVDPLSVDVRNPEDDETKH